VDPEITDRGCRLNKVRAYSNRCPWDLMLTSAGRTPEDLGLTGIQLEPVTPHPQGDLVDTRRYPLLELRCRRWMAGAVYLRVVSIQMWPGLILVDQLQQVRRIQHEQDRSEDRPLWYSAQKKGKGEGICAATDILRATVEM